MSAEPLLAAPTSVQVTYRPCEQLMPYARNSRTHSPGQIAQIAASIAAFGWTNPVLADAQGIVAGHGRVLGAERLYARGATLRLPNGEAIPAGCVPVLDCGGWTDAQRRAYVIADNQIALNAGWDEDLLRTEVSALDGLGFDLKLLSFSDKDLGLLLAPAGTPGESDPDDEAPPPPEESVSVLGDVWLLGRHRLVCGDCTDPETVALALNGARPHLMVTDPPYGVEYDAGWRNESMPAKNDPERWRDGRGRAIGAVRNDDRADWREAWALFPGDVAYVWHAAAFTHVVAESLIATGLEIRSQIIWAKNQFVISRGHYHGHHEPCWYVVRKGATGHWSGDRTQSTLWQIDKPRKSETGHSTQKPIDCMRRPIENNSLPGEAVYEPFCGSGTTIIACEMTGRTCLALELEPAYVDVTVERWQAFTGRRAVHADTGEPFPEAVDALVGGGS